MLLSTRRHAEMNQNLIIKRLTVQKKKPKLMKSFVGVVFKNHLLLNSTFEAEVIYPNANRSSHRGPMVAAGRMQNQRCIDSGRGNLQSALVSSCHGSMGRGSCP